MNETPHHNKDDGGHALIAESRASRVPNAKPVTVEVPMIVQMDHLGMRLDNAAAQLKLYRCDGRIFLFRYATGCEAQEATLINAAVDVTVLVNSLEDHFQEARQEALYAKQQEQA